MSLAPSEKNGVQSGDGFVAYQRQLLLGSIASMVAHELNNLMAPVLSRAQLAQMTQAPDSIAKAVEVAARNTEHAVSISRRLLEMAQGLDAEPRSYPVREALDRVGLTFARPMDKDGIDYAEDIADGLAVQADPILFDQVLMNLLLNARKATERGRIRVVAAPVDGQARVEVIDNGVGIEPERMDKVIRPFLAAPPDHDPHSWVHVGLGLHACRWIVNQHNGRIEAEGNEQGGCTFRVYWPLG